MLIVSCETTTTSSSSSSSSTAAAATTTTTTTTTITINKSLVLLRWPRYVVQVEFSLSSGLERTSL